MQEAVVGLIVVCAFWAVAKRYLPKAVRRAIRSQSVRMAKRLGWHRIADQLSAAEEKGGSCSDGCGSCGGCGTDATAPRPADDERFVIKLKAVR